MAKKKQHGLKGKPSNNKSGKGGRPFLGPEAHLIRRFNKLDVERIFSEAITKTVRELERVYNDPTSTSLEAAVAKILYEAVRTGDHTKLEAMLQRAVGRVPNEVNVQGSLHSGLVDYLEQAENADTRAQEKTIQ